MKCKVKIFSLVIPVLSLFSGFFLIQTAHAATYATIVDDNFTRSNTAFNASAGGTSVGAPSVFSSPSAGASWVDVTGNSWKINNNTLVFNSSSSNSYITSKLMRPASEATLNQKVSLVTDAIAGSNESYVIFLREQTNGDGVWVEVNSGTGISLQYHNTGGSIAFGNNVSFAMTMGHQYVITATALTPVADPLKRNDTYYTVTVSDLAASTTVLAQSIAPFPEGLGDGSIYSTNFSGTVGIGAVSTSPLSGIARFTYSQLTDTTQGIPGNLATNSSGNIINLYNTGTAWTPGTPGSPTFSISGVPGVAISQQVVLSTSTAQITITTGNATGTAIVSDPGSGSSFGVNIIPPAGDSPVFYYAGYQYQDTATNTIKISIDPPRGGQAPYTYQWFRSLTSNFATSSLVAGATGLTMIDTPPDNQVYYYKIVATDSYVTPQTGSKIVSGIRGYFDPPTTPSLGVANNVPPLKIGFIGDSITYDSGAFGSLTTDFLSDIQNQGNVTPVTTVNEGIPGTTMVSWTPGNVDGFYAAAKAAFLSAGVNYVILMFGVNDCGTSAAAYQAALLSIVNDLNAAGITVYINSEASPAYIEPLEDCLSSYSDVVDQVATTSMIVRGDKMALAYLPERENQSDFAVHPNSLGSINWALYQAYAFLNYLSQTFPSLSSVNSVVFVPSLNGATITWTSNASSTSQVNFGLNSSYTSSSTLNVATTTSHSVLLAGLAPATTYHFQVISEDPSGHIATSSDQTFTTLAAPTPSPSVPSDSYSSGGGGSASPAALAGILAPSASTTAYLNFLKKTAPGCPAGLICVPVATTSIAIAASTFTRDLTLGSQGNDVKALQMYLNAHGFPVATYGNGSSGHETNYFGILTQAALAKFQQAHGITPSVGYFGPITRAKIRASA